MSANQPDAHRPQHMTAYLNICKVRLPGVLWALLIAIPAYLIGKWLPVVGGPVSAMLIGIALGELMRRGGSKAERRLICFRPGLQWTSKKLLQLAVILLGFGLNLREIMRVGSQSILIILSTISVSLIVSFLFFKLFKSGAKSTVLVGVGSSICGGSAIAATAPVIQADDEEIAEAMSVIFLFNVIAALIFPSLGGLLDMTNEGFGIFAGTAVNDTSSVTAAASAWDSLHGGNALQIATIVKLTRTLVIIPITLLLAFRQGRKIQQAATDSQSDSGLTQRNAAGGQTNAFSLRRIFPLFILYFVLASILTTFLTIPADVVHALKELSKILIIMAMAAIGFHTHLSKLIRNGGPAILQGLVCWICIALTSLGMQQIQGIW